MKSKSFSSAYTKMFLIPSKLYEKIISKMDDIEKEKMFEINRGDDDQNDTETSNYDLKENINNDTKLFADNTEAQNDNTDIDSDVNQAKEIVTQTDLQPLQEESIQKSSSNISQEDVNDTNSKQFKDVSTQTDYSNSRNISVQTEPRNTLRSIQSNENKISVEDTMKGDRKKLKKFLCNICQNFYSTKWVLKRHVQTQHTQKDKNIEKLQDIESVRGEKRKIDDETLPMKKLRPQKGEKRGHKVIDSIPRKKFRAFRGKKRKLIDDNDPQIVRKKMKFPTWSR